MIQPLKKKEKKTLLIFSTHRWILVVSLNPCQPSFPSRKEIERRSSTFFLDIFLLWWGVTLHEMIHDMKGRKRVKFHSLWWKEVKRKFSYRCSPAAITFVFTSVISVNGHSYYTSLLSSQLSSAAWGWLCPSCALFPAAVMDEGSRHKTPFPAFGICHNILGKFGFFFGSHQGSAGTVKPELPLLRSDTQHCQKRVMLKCSAQLYRLKMPVPAQLRRISEVHCWYNKCEDISNNSEQQQQQKCCKGQEGSWEKKTRQAKKFGVGAQY